MNGMAVLAARTEKAWHNYILNQANCEVMFVQGRVKYLLPDNSESLNPSTFPMLFGGNSIKMETGKRKGLQDIIECMSCGLGFWDKYNLICLNALDLCLHCASKNLI